MPDQTSGRPPGDRDGADGPDYGWLYGGRPGSEGAPSGATGGRGDDPEPTQVLPTIQRPAGTGQASQRPPRTSGQRPPSAPVPPPGGPARPATPARAPRRRRPIGKIVLAVVLLWIVFLVAVPAWAWSRIDKVDATPSGARPADQPGTTYLLVGSDSRKGLTAAQQRRLGVGGVGDVGQRTDTIMLLHTGSGPNLLLSIPRDSLVPIPGHGTTKINEAFSYGGPKLLVKTIEQDTGVRVDDYVEIGFGGFVNSVDAVGGITICPHHDLNDRRSNLHVKKGCQNVDGATALAFSRDRHSYALQDIQRVKNQRAVVAAIGHKVISPWTILNPFRYFAINKAAVSSLKVSQGTGPWAMAMFAVAMAKGGTNCTMPISVSTTSVHWDRPRALALMKLIKEDRTSAVTPRLCGPKG